MQLSNSYPNCIDFACLSLPFSSGWLWPLLFASLPRTEISGLLLRSCLHFKACEANLFYFKYSVAVRWIPPEKHLLLDSCSSLISGE